MDPLPLPAALGDGAFTTADAARLGVSSGRLAARDLAAPFHGVRCAIDAPQATVTERAALLLPRLTPLQVFTHTTAAAIHGIPLPPAASAAIHVGALGATREPRTRGVVGHRLMLAPDLVTFVRGLPVPPAPLVWAQLGALLGTDDLIVAADHLLGPMRIPRDELIDAVGRGRRGARRLLAALDEARAGAESPQETRVRLVLTRGGLPEPTLNGDLRRRDGRFVARLDLAYRPWRVCVEYDGRQHADAVQFQRDAERWSAIEAEGWCIVRVLAHHFHDPGRLILGRVRTALAARGYRP